jgi:hypothetical protein
VEKYVIARQATDENIKRRMHFVCWITTATGTHSEHVLFFAFPQLQWFRERVSMLCLYEHWLPFYNYRGMKLSQRQNSILASGTERTVRWFKYD